MTLAAGAAAREPEPLPLPLRVGGALGFTADAAAFPDSASSDQQLEVYLRLPPSTLVSLTRSEQGEGRIKLTVRLLNRFGALQHEARQEFNVVPSDTGTFGKVVMLRFPVKPGSYRMAVRIEDPLSRKRGLVYMGRRVPESSEAEGEITVLAAVAGRRLSDLEFVWGEAGQQYSLFRRPGAAAGFLPNPERLYGLLASELKVQFVAHATDGRTQAWRWRTSILDGRGQVVAQRESTVAAGPWLVQTVGTDVSTEPAGSYEVEVRAWRDGDAEPLVRRSRFSIAWRPITWRRNLRDLEDEMHFLLDREEDEEAFVRRSPGDQERFLEDFWRERDPTPATAVNEARLEFYGRIEHANRTWSQPSGKGMFSDMGRVHIRHGEPSEILRQVVPAGDQTLEQLLQEMNVSEDRPTGDLRSKGPGGDMRPFEVWVYEGERGRPITAKPDPSSSDRIRRRLLFLFVDERGYGEYRLRYSTE